MTWLVVNASAAGTSHAADKKPCEDRSLARVEARREKEPLLMLFAADGAGSARCGGKGAELAVEAAAKFVSKRYAEKKSLALDEKLAEKCVRAARQKIIDEAARKKAVARDYACTFLGVIGTPSATLLMQVGDGGIVVDTGNGLEVPITPPSGEYANMTNFITDENAMDALATRALQGGVKKAALFTDGLQRLALKMDSNTAHEPFFTNFFKVLATADKSREKALQKELEQFLQSPAVNDRTDDDKTLVLAHWIE